MYLRAGAIVDNSTDIRVGLPAETNPNYFVEFGEYDALLAVQFEDVADLRRLHEAIGAVLPPAEQIPDPRSGE